MMFLVALLIVLPFIALVALVAIPTVVVLTKFSMIYDEVKASQPSSALVPQSVPYTG
jgi:hypothetical protein